MFINPTSHDSSTTTRSTDTSSFHSIGSDSLEPSTRIESQLVSPNDKKWLPYIGAFCSISGTIKKRIMLPRM